MNKILTALYITLFLVICLSALGALYYVHRTQGAISDEAGWIITAPTSVALLTLTGVFLADGKREGKRLTKRR
ncbi:hypothetical protein [Prauserella alba]|uniref:Uncharacterized protein n=1 Tax=Prauserella alba TaxID=176898 RepID=A0ABN1VF90_9PSEU|nr:hypothetical protein [Prauserella alba]MCP2180019.1 hypothetical protein [Prauserella alba]